MATRKKATAKKKRPVRSSQKKTAKKTTAKKRAAKRPGKPAPRKKTATRSRSASTKTLPAKKPIPIEPGPPPGSVPPVEEPTVREAAVGVVTHYYGHLGVAVVQVNTGTLRAGDTIHIKGNTTDFTQQVASMEYEHQHVNEANPGQSVGIKTVDHAREHDIVYAVK